MGVRGVLEDIALVAQLSGLHAIMLIALAMRLLRILQCEAECAKLEECTRKLRVLLQWGWPLPAGREVAAQLATGALVEADGLMAKYRRSSLWCKVRTGRSMEARLRGMQDRVCFFFFFLCLLLLCMPANLLTNHPASDTTNATQEGAENQSDNIEPEEFESAV